MKNAIIWDEETVKKELIRHFGNEYIEEIENSFEYNNILGNGGNFKKDGEEYIFIESEEIAEGKAIDQVKEDLGDSPEMFTQTWLQDFLYISDTDKRIMCNDEEDYIREQVRDEKLDEEESPEKEEEIEKVVETRLDEYRTSLENPIEYFVNEQGIYSVEDLMKQNWINIKIDEAAEDAVRTDGWAHFLSRYDGEHKTTENGIVYFRD